LSRVCHQDAASLIRVETFTGSRAVTRASAGSFENGLALGQSRPTGKNLRLSSRWPPFSRRPALGRCRGQMTEDREQKKKKECNPGFLIFGTLWGKGQRLGWIVQPVWAGLRDKAALPGKESGFRVGRRFPSGRPWGQVYMHRTDSGKEVHTRGRAERSLLLEPSYLRAQELISFLWAILSFFSRSWI